METYLAVDIGASSGRTFWAGWRRAGSVWRKSTASKIRSSGKTAVSAGTWSAWPGRSCGAWSAAGSWGKIPSTMGIDTWAVDYVLLDERGQPLGDTVAYRDSRTQGMDKLVEQRVPFQELYRRTGIQKQDFNTSTS